MNVKQRRKKETIEIKEAFFFIIIQESLSFLDRVAQDKQEVGWSWKKPALKNKCCDWRDDDSRANEKVQPDAGGRQSLCDSASGFEAPLSTTVAARFSVKTVNSTALRLNKTDNDVSQAQREHADEATWGVVVRRQQRK